MADNRPVYSAQFKGSAVPISATPGGLAALSSWRETLGWTWRGDGDLDVSLLDEVGDEVASAFLAANERWTWYAPPVNEGNPGAGEYETRDEALRAALTRALLRWVVAELPGWTARLTGDEARVERAVVGVQLPEVVAEVRKRGGVFETRTAYSRIGPGATASGVVAWHDPGGALAEVVCSSLRRANELGILELSSAPGVEPETPADLDEELLERARRELDRF